MTPPVAKYAKKYGIPLPLANALIGQESGGNSGAVSSAGATGLTQVLPSTAAGMYGISEAQAAQRLRNPAFALDAGFRYLAAQKKAFGSWRLALAAYNAGPNAVKEFGGIPPYQETQDYVRNILGRATLPSTAAVNEGSSAVTGQAAATPQFDPSQLALQNLADIAQGSYKPTEALSNLAASVHATGSVSTPNAQEGPGGTSTPSVSFQLPKRLTKNVRSAVSLAQQYLGTPYVWGGESPKGFDCSGLLQYVWARQGVNIPRTTYDQFQSGTQIPRSRLRPGDAVFFTGSDPKNGLPGHVGMYIGNGRFIEAPGSGKVVRISRLAGRKDFVGARRYN